MACRLPGGAVRLFLLEGGPQHVTFKIRLDGATRGFLPWTSGCARHVRVQYDAAPGYGEVGMNEHFW